MIANKKFGEIIKGDKSKNLGIVKTTFKLDKLDNNNPNYNNNTVSINSYNKNDAEKLKSRSHLIY
jgi:hypothetical protein